MSISIYKPLKYSLYVHDFKWFYVWKSQITLIPYYL